MTQECRVCQHANPEWAQFCAQCGTGFETTQTAIPAHPVDDAHVAPPPLNVPPKSGGGRQFMWIAVVVLMGMGWFWVMIPPSRRQHIHDEPTSHIHHTQGPFASNSYNAAPAPQTFQRKTYSLDKELTEALWGLLSPDHVTIVVSRPDDRVLSVQGTDEQIAAIDAFLAELKSDGFSLRSDKTQTYQLTPNQARSLQKALACGKRSIHVRRNGSTLRVRGKPSLHDSIERLIPYLEQRMQSMVDVSKTRPY
jgi:hypothetical protein